MHSHHRWNFRLTNEILIRPFQLKDQDAAKALILSGMKEHWGFIDPTKNPDLDDIATYYVWQGIAVK